MLFLIERFPAHFFILLTVEEIKVCYVIEYEIIGKKQNFHRLRLADCHGPISDLNCLIDFFANRQLDLLWLCPNPNRLLLILYDLSKAAPNPMVYQQ